MTGIAEATILRQFAIVGTVSLVFLAGCGKVPLNSVPANSSPAPTTTPSPNFTAVGSMSTARANHTATLLPNGKVLIAGGITGKQALSSAELYDPATKTFTATGSLTAARAYHTATLLPNGKVLIAGGSDGTQYLNSAELYDPTSGTFAPTGSMQGAGSSGSEFSSVRPAVLLTNGKVLFAGDAFDGDNAQLYDPATGTFALAGPYADEFSMLWTTATVLADGRVLLTGTTAAGNAFGTELFDPNGGGFSMTGSTGYGLDTATLLTDGTVLVVSADGDLYFDDDAAIYDPASGTSIGIGQTLGLHGNSAAVRLPDGSVLISGGEIQSSSSSTFTERYLPSTRTFQSAGNMNTGRIMHTATLLPDGTVLIVGGESAWGTSPQMTSTAEIYTPPSTGK